MDKNTKETIKIALAGQPNVGKSLLINSISSSKLKVGNFSGVTIEKSEVQFEHNNEKLKIIDLPGTYSIKGFSEEEKVAREYLLNEDYDIILNVLDSTKLTRNLLLTLELISLNKKMVIALNMIDEAQNDGLIINAEQIEAITGIPTVCVSASAKLGIDELLDRIHKTFGNKRKPATINYSDTYEKEIFIIEKYLTENAFNYNNLTNREVAMKLLKEDEQMYKIIHEKPIFMGLHDKLSNSINNIHNYYETKNSNDIINQERSAIARGIKTETVTRKASSKQVQVTLTKKIDNFLINKFIGIPIFLFLMWGLFQLTFEFGAIPMDYIDAGFSWLADAVGQSIKHEELRSLISDGIISGVGAVMLFLPNIIILYIGITLLETTGYMARVAFLLDGFFHKFGLHGKSFIPLVTGFGCSVPAYMAARTLKNKKDRLITMFITGFMSCGAKLPIYVLFIGAFFDTKDAGNILFIIYIGGALLGLIMAKVLRVFIFKGKDEPFVMEMPKYRMPTLKTIYMLVSQKSCSYVKKAGTFILAASVLIWFASNYPKQPELEKQYLTKIELAGSTTQANILKNELKLKQLERSYLGKIGKSTEFIFAPIGFDWKMTVALETGLAAKEIVVATLGILYSIGDEVDETDNSLISQLRANISFASAMSFLVFCLIYLPCLAASMVFVKESGGYKYLGYLFVFTTSLAWILSFITYRILLLIK